MIAGVSVVVDPSMPEDTAVLRSANSAVQIVGLTTGDDEGAVGSKSNVWDPEVDGKGLNRKQRRAAEKMARAGFDTERIRLDLHDSLVYSGKRRSVIAAGRAPDYVMV